jgi:hypothetical protein
VINRDLVKKEKGLGSMLKPKVRQHLHNPGNPGNGWWRFEDRRVSGMIESKSFDSLFRLNS